MPLSQYELEVLAAIEEGLRDEDPALAAVLDGELPSSPSDSVPTVRIRDLLALHGPVVEDDRAASRAGQDAAGCVGAAAERASPEMRRSHVSSTWGAVGRETMLPIT
jgi:Protein of unknown function (DUF3040)